MGIKFILGVAAAAVGGIYLTSDEGKKAREAIRKKKSTFEPIVKRLISDANEILDGSKDIASTEIRNDVRKLTNEAKKTLVSLDLEKTVETIKKAIKVASKKINDASNEMPKPKKKTKTVAKKVTKTQTVKTTKKTAPKKTK